MTKNISVSGNPQNVDRDITATVQQIVAAARYTEKMFGVLPTAKQISMHGSSFKRGVVPESLQKNLARAVNLEYIEEIHDDGREFRYRLTKKGEGLVYARDCGPEMRDSRWNHMLRHGGARIWE